MRKQSLAMRACVARTCAALFMGLIASFGPNHVQAELPRTMHIMVPFPPGGPIDFSARVLADGLREKTGSVVIIENRPSGGGNVAALAVKQAPPDGSNLLFNNSSMVSINPHLQVP